jgi:type I thyroxine 5'-deiodinase
MESNVEQGVCYRQPRSTAERVAIARDFVERFGYPLPLLVDPIENPANAIYAGWPERLYILDERRTIVYKGDPGPFGFHPEEAEEWLRQRFGGVGAESPGG